MQRDPSYYEGVRDALAALPEPLCKAHPTIVHELSVAADNIDVAMTNAITGCLGGWEHTAIRRILPFLAEVTRGTSDGHIEPQGTIKRYEDGRDDTLRDLLDAWPKETPTGLNYDECSGYFLALEETRAMISALLPQPKDEAEEIVRAYESVEPVWYTDHERQKNMVHWLLSQGWKRPDHHQHADRG